MLAGKTLLVYTNLFSPNDSKDNDRKYINILKINMTEEERLEFRLKKQMKKNKKTLLEEINHNYLTSEKYKKACNYLNYIENLLILL